MPPSRKQSKTRPRQVDDADEQAAKVAPLTQTGSYVADQVKLLGFPIPPMPKDLLEWPEDLSQVDGLTLSKLLTNYAALRSRAQHMKALVENDLAAHDAYIKRLKEEKLVRLRVSGDVSVTEKKALVAVDPQVVAGERDVAHATATLNLVCSHFDNFEWHWKTVSREMTRRGSDIEE